MTKYFYVKMYIVTIIKLFSRISELVNLLVAIIMEFPRCLELRELVCDVCDKFLPFKECNGNSQIAIFTNSLILDTKKNSCEVSL